MKVWMSVAAAVVDRLGRRRAMFRRWKKIVLVIWLTWGRKERVGSRITPRLRILVEGVMVEPSMLRVKFRVD